MTSWWLGSSLNDRLGRRVRRILFGGAGPGGPCNLDEIDRHIVRELARDARLPNNTLAERVGIAPVDLPGPGAGRCASAA